MKTNVFGFILTILLLASQENHAQTAEKYKGRLVAFDGTYDGDITVNMLSENTRRIKVEWEKILPDSSKKIQYRAEYDPGAIQNIIIKNDTFFIKDLEDSEDKIRAGCLVKKIYGSEMMGIYQYNSKEGARYYIGLPRRDLIYIMHPRFSDEANLYTAFVFFKECDELYKKIKSAQEGYWFKRHSTPDQRMLIWKKIFSEFSACKK